MELLPGADAFVGGEFEIECPYILHQLDAEPVGDLMRYAYALETDYGWARYEALGRGPYFVDWGTYDFRRGLSYFASIDRPFIELHFQLEGAVRSVRNGMDLVFDLRAGDNNLVYMPATRGRFELEMETAGEVFEVLLTPEYFAGLAERYPEVLGVYLERMERGESFFLSPDQLCITPAMRGIIHHLRQHRPTNAGSLFLESQILQLLALQLEQSARPRRRHALSRADVERLHAARDHLLGRLADPPSLADLARHVGTNEFTLKRGFRTLFGTSPYAFVLEHRLARARALVLDTDLTLAEIAYRSGYSDPAHFTNAFRRQYGVPPSALR